MCIFGEPTCFGIAQTKLMWGMVVFSAMNYLETDPIIARSAPGSDCRRHKVLVLNLVSAANFTVLIGCMLACVNIQDLFAL